MAKAIKVTTENKTANPDFFNGNAVGSIVAKSLPRNYNGVEILNAGGYHTRTDLHLQDGFKDIVQPTYNTSIQKLGSLIENGDTFTYQVIDKTDQEIQNDIISNAKAEQQTLIQQNLEAQVLADAQNDDDTTSLENQALFPIWEHPFDYTIDFKCQHFTNDNELVLYKCVQAHTSQSDWQPRNVPALFTRVAYPNQILDWVQPTGAQDAYQIGDQVHHDNPNDGGNIWLYESKINANTTEPGRDGTFDRWWEPLEPK